MSRVGNKVLTIPGEVTITNEDNFLTVKGPKGELTRQFSKAMKININDGQVTVERPNDAKENRMLHGTTTALINNMIEGVSKGFEIALVLTGVGYRAQKQGTKLVLSLGYSHPVEVEPEAGIEIDVPSQTEIIVKGIDKQRVGEIAANIRKYRRPEPYKGKGVAYKGERIRRKEGKTAGKK
ncbi:50S ribosomal protein L6 [Culicoidibacter larvae]|uniref:Large ribosomal subunit protein uL6 n=1 Tax=Culicoidibacter larvae TaxID=2579976 RepID=A0A5R8QHJ3_9FIRM|nr:50S ribosomal protein L6 [Culicoidibacter larvae]TLG77432.1 50S ribosomal protein L6 [Culicoidibacter larvae]